MNSANHKAPAAEAGREKLERHRRQRLLVKLLDDLDAEHGPVDERLVEKYLELLE